MNGIDKIEQLNRFNERLALAYNYAKGRTDQEKMDEAYYNDQEAQQRNSEFENLGDPDWQSLVSKWRSYLSLMTDEGERGDEIASLLRSREELYYQLTDAFMVDKYMTGPTAEDYREQGSAADEAIDVAGLIDDLPRGDAITLSDAEAIQEAAAAYAALSDAQKALISDEIVSTLAAAERRLKELPAESYTVTFVDGQGNTLKMETVEKGSAATAPTDPTRDGYTFDGWDKNFSNITSNLTVTAKWKENTTPLEPQEPVSIKDAKVVLSANAFTYNAKVQKPALKSVKAGGSDLVEGKDYTVEWSNEASKDASTYSVSVIGKGDYVGAVESQYTIYKAKNTIKASGKTVKVKMKTLNKKKKVTVKRAKAIKVSKQVGKLKYKKVIVSNKKINKKYGKKFVVNAKTGNITVKKGVKKGTYKVKVKVTAAGNSNYKAGTKTVVVKVNVK